MSGVQDAAQDAPFEWLSDRLLETTSLGERTAQGNPRRREMAVRGTVRLALKKSGLPQQGVSREELRTVIQQVLPDLLRSCSVDDAAGICEKLAAEIASQRFGERQRDDYFGGFLKRAVT